MRKVNSSKSILGFVSAAHFLVDFSCIFLVTSLLPGEQGIFFALLYNFCAFGLQFPVGILADFFRSHLLHQSLGHGTAAGVSRANKKNMHTFHPVSKT